MGAYGLRREQNIDLLVKTALEYGVTDRRQLAYIVATAQHESDNFATAREYDGRNQAIARGYDGGANYYGRGYVQVTHRDNYESMARVLRDARIARDPDIVAHRPGSAQKPPWSEWCVVSTPAWRLASTSTTSVPIMLRLAR